MAIGAAIGIAMGLKEAIEYLSRKKLPKTTPYIQELQRLSREGISEAEIDKQLSLISRSEGNIAGITSSRIRQGLAGRGITGVATERAIEAPRLEMQERIGTARTKLGLESVRVKEAAGRRLGLARTQLSEQRRVEEGQARIKLLGGLTGAALTGVDIEMAARETEKIDKMFREFLGLGKTVETPALKRPGIRSPDRFEVGEKISGQPLRIHSRMRGVSDIRDIEGLPYPIRESRYIQDWFGKPFPKLGKRRRRLGLR